MEVRLIDKEDAKQRVMSNAVFSGYRNILATTARLTLDRKLTEPKENKNKLQWLMFCRLSFDLWLV